MPLMRRRLYLMRHTAVAYFDNGRPVDPATVSLTEDGRGQARAAREAFADTSLDRVLTSGLARTVETARIVSPAHEPESWPELRELEPGRLADPARAQRTGAEIVLVEELEDALEDEQGRSLELRRLFRGLDDVVRRHRAILCR